MGKQKELDMTEQLTKTHHGPQVHAIHLVKVEVVWSCLTHCDPMDYTALGILQARILEPVAVPFSGGSSQPRDANPDLPHCRQILYQLSHQGSPRILE